jgi:hypothetical protein
MARELSVGFEFGNKPADQISAEYATTYYTTPGGVRPTDAHKVPVSGAGGRQFAECDQTTFTAFTPDDEVYIGGAIAGETNVAGDARWLFIWRDGPTQLGGVYTPSDGRIWIYTGGGTFRLSTAQTWYASDAKWRWWSVHVLIADVLGVIEVRLNEERILSYTGDTKPGTETTVNVLKLSTGGTCYDDIVVNSTHYTICYDGGATPANVPAVGSTVTDGGAKSAVVRNYAGDGTSGVLTVDTIVGVWADGDAIGDGVSFSAVTLGGANAGNRTWPNEQYITLTSATGAGATTAWTASAGSNYQCIDELPPATYPDTTDYVSSTVAGNVDTYAWGSIAASAVLVDDVQVAIYARRDGTGIRHVRAQVRTGGTTYDYAGLIEGTSWLWARAPAVIDPTTLAQWTVANLNAAEFGVKSSL